MQRWLGITGVALGLAAASPAAADYYETARFQSHSLQFTYPTSWGTPAEVPVPACPLLDPNDKPDGVSPAHVAIQFRGNSASAHGNPRACDFPAFDRAQFRVLSVDAWQRAAPKSRATFAALRGVLEAGTLAPGADVPFAPFVDAFPALTEHVAFVPFGKGRGVAFLTQWMIEPDSIGPALAYVFQGLSTDGKTYVLGVFPVRLRDPLPPFKAPPAEAYEQSLARYRVYAAAVAQTIRKTPEQAFAPALSQVVALLHTLRLP